MKCDPWFYLDILQRFKEKVELWCGLQHRNVLRFFGYVKIDDIVYSVCRATSRRTIFWPVCDFRLAHGWTMVISENTFEKIRTPTVCVYLAKLLRVRAMSIWLCLRPLSITPGMEFLHENGIVHGDLCGVSPCHISSPLLSRASYLEKRFDRRIRQSLYLRV